MIVGVGTDIIEIERIQKAILHNRFLIKHFTEAENQYFAKKGFSAETIAGNFAAKEAVAKALGTGFRGFSLQDLAVLRTEQGKPYIEVYAEAKIQKEILGIGQFHVSISHCQRYAVAYVIAEGE